MRYTILSLLIVMILLAGCVSVQDTKTLNSATPIQEKVVESSDWLTYSNEKYNIKIDYPSDWRVYEEISDSPDNPYFIVEFSKKKVDLAVVIMPSVYDSLDDFVKVSMSIYDSFEGFSLVGLQGLKLKGYDAHKIIYTAVSKEIYFRKVHTRLLIKDGYTYTIKFKAKGDDASVSSYDEYAKTIEKMVASLRI